jgi:serine protein kinase
MADDFQKLIQDDRDVRTKKSWSGTTLQYLELVRNDPSVARLAHKRIFEALMRPGVTEVNLEENPRLKRLHRESKFKVYNFFKEQFFGMDKTLNQIVRYFHSASLKGEESRQVLYLVGPVGSGKSSLVEKLKSGLEMEEPFHAIEGCPMYEEPLHLIPRHLRKEFSRMLDIEIEGDLCPVCRYRLKEEFQSRWEEMPIRTYQFSIRAKRGIGVVPPVDPNNQDTSVLIGGEDISKLDLYSEGDPPCARSKRCTERR